jgi:Zn-dependent protease with chaperone function
MANRWLGLFLFAIFCLAAPAFADEPLPVPQPTPEALAYHHGQNLFWLADQALGFIVPAVILFTGWSAGLTGWARRVTGGRWYPTLVLYGILYSVIVFIVALPLAYARDYVFAHAYDQSNQTLGRWAHDEAVGLLVQLIILALVIWIPFLLIRRSPRRWWLWSTAALTPLFIVGIVLTPIWIQPLFNKFTPLPDGELKTRIEAQAASGGLNNATILQMDQSADSKTFGAYVAGLGGTARIVIYDTALTTLDQRELLFVLGHEMKHYLLGDVWKIVAMFVLLALVGFFAVDRLARAAIRRWSGSFGFTELSDPAALPLLLLVFGLVSLVATPITNAVSRHIEHEADRFGLEITRDNHAAASAFIKRNNEAMGVPYPGWLERTFRLDHPSLGDRITFANDYHPWEEGKPMVYGHWIKPAK